MARKSPRRRRPPASRSEPRVSPRARRRAHAVVAAQEDRAARLPGEAPPASGVRLNRWLAERGVASRRGADQLILSGAVEVNGEVVLTPGRRVQPGDEVCVNGARVKEVPRLYYAFHKPKGVICTDSVREVRPRVRDLVEPLVPARVHAVGRLDEDSEGLLLLTNDGDFANYVAHPRYGVPRTYIVKVGGAMPGEVLARLREGVYLAEGKVVPGRIRVVKRTPRTTTLEVVIREGVNREIRRMLARVGFRVKALKRVRIGPVGLAGIPRGALRPLTAAERDALLALARGEDEAEVEAALRRARRGRPPKARRIGRRPAAGRRGGED